MSSMDAFIAAKAKITTAKLEAQAVLRQAFTEEAKAIFDKHPEVENFSWRQYTPYFNDGDTCTFNACVDDVYVNGLSKYGDTWEGDEEGEPLAKDVFKTISTFLSNFDDDDYLSLFDDHMEVTVNRDGSIDVNEYDHD